MEPGWVRERKAARYRETNLGSFPLHLPYRRQTQCPAHPARLCPISKGPVDLAFTTALFLLRPELKSRTWWLKAKLFVGRRGLECGSEMTEFPADSVTSSLSEPVRLICWPQLVTTFPNTVGRVRKGPLAPRC